MRQLRCRFSKDYSQKYIYLVRAPLESAEQVLDIAVVGRYCFTTSPIVMSELFSDKLTYEPTVAFAKVVEDKNQQI